MIAVTTPRLAVIGVSTLISTLAYGSQLLFRYLDPGPLDNQEFWYFNGLLGCLWISYARACLVDPGDLRSSQLSQSSKGTDGIATSDGKQPGNDVKEGSRWCKKCDAFKPPRAHHCKVCKRFLFYACASMVKLAQYQLARVAVIWESRNLPSYLGPSPLRLGALFVFCALNALTLFGVGIIFLRTIYSLATNVTAIESWEIERHETLVRRARKQGGYLDGPDGRKIHIVKQEFPYDIGIWSNICQGMDGGPLSWFWPLARTAPVESGLAFEVNEFEEPGTPWPPPDPDKMPRTRRVVDMSDVALELDDDLTAQDRLRAFKKRQEADLRRRRTHTAWTDSEGQMLEDFGVDDASEASSVEEDDIPIAQLLAKRRGKQ